MNWLQRLELNTEKIIEGIFGPNEARPVTLANKLLREMTRQKLVSVNKVYVPGKYHLILPLQGGLKLNAVKNSLVDELTDFLKTKALEKGYTFLTQPIVNLSLDPETAAGVRVESFWEGEEEKLGLWIVEVENEEFPLDKNEVIVGRDKETADICLQGKNVSRQHALLSKWDKGWLIRDMGSTNGTLVAGRAVNFAFLVGGEKVTIGEISFRLRRLAQWHH